MASPLHPLILPAPARSGPPSFMHPPKNCTLAKRKGRRGMPAAPPVTQAGGGCRVQGGVPTQPSAPSSPALCPPPPAHCPHSRARPRDRIPRQSPSPKRPKAVQSTAKPRCTQRALSPALAASHTVLAMAEEAAGALVVGRTATGPGRPGNTYPRERKNAHACAHENDDTGMGQHGAWQGEARRRGEGEGAVLGEAGVACILLPHPLPHPLPFRNARARLRDDAARSAHSHYMLAGAALAPVRHRDVRAGCA